VLLALAAFAVLDEATQPVFGRHADPLDWVYDCIGLTAGLVLVAIGHRAVSARQA
jgi:VanZ family protein